MDAQRIKFLTNYLQVLHEKGLANENHTTLLLNCYTKLNESKLLNEFIRKDVSFDVETAINVCRQTGFFTEAVFLAKKFDQYDLFLSIQMEDLKDVEACLRYIEGMEDCVLV